MACVSVYRWEDLPADDRAAWGDIQRAGELWASPFFHPAFTEAVAACRDDVEVAVWRDGDARGFLPYQRRRRVAEPIGGALGDFQGLVLPQGATFSPAVLFAECGLRCYTFHHWVAEQVELAPWCFHRAGSAYVDLSTGFEAYQHAKRAEGSNLFEQHRRKSKKLASEVGPLRLELGGHDADRLRALIAWKTAQYAQTGKPNALAPTWTTALLENTLRRNDPEFRGELAALLAGDRVAALCLGLRCRAVWHAWFPAYDASLARHSPGALLWLELLRRLADTGARRVDFGKGDEHFKHRLATHHQQVAEGAYDTRPWARLARAGWYAARRFVHATPLAGWPLRLYRRWQARSSG